MKSGLRFVIITGLSGAGKSFAIKALEDLGYYCVDNLPTALIPTFADLATTSARGIRRIALGIDIREGEYLAPIQEVLGQLKSGGHQVAILFLEASDEILVRRYHETRRKHPLAGEGAVMDGIRLERKKLAHLRELADRVIDSSHLTVHQLRDRLAELYSETGEGTQFLVTLASFGYKYGVPFDADLVFDVRFLPNPFFVDALKGYDGRHPEVVSFILSHPESQEFLRRLQDFVGYLLPQYQREGKSYLTIAVGCTGGKHRSVTVVEQLRAFMEKKGLAPLVSHRDVDRE